MLITRNILNKALEDKVPLFHDGDYIDNDVLYDLFYAPAKLQNLPNGKIGKVAFISKENRSILCAELMRHISKKPQERFDKIYCKLKCKSCGKDFVVHMTKNQIVNRLFKIDDNIDIHVYNDNYNLFTSAFTFRFYMKFGRAYDLYICKSCIDKFISDSKQEALEFLERKDKFDWFLSEESYGDWKRELFNVFPQIEHEGIRIYAANGEFWTDEKYAEWERCKEEERDHKRKLEEIHRQQKLDEEAECQKTRNANELFLARHQLNTPTQIYIDKFCNKHSDIDITDKEIQREALSPEGVNYEAIQKHNSKLYREYLQSPLWKIISSKVKWNANYCCEKCGLKTNLVVHHTSYEFKGIEFLAFETLQCLCSRCHEEEHEK